MNPRETADSARPADSPLPRLAEMTWTEVAGLDRERTVPILPVGAVEAHGPHLPLATDVLIAEGMAAAAAPALVSAGLQPLLLPPLAYTAAGFAAGFAGTLSAPEETVTSTLRALAVGLHDHGFRRLALANAHFDPGHVAALRGLAAEPLPLTLVFPDLTRRRLAERLGDEFRSGACHAGRYEGSLVLALRPDLVREESRLGLPANPRSLLDAFAAGHRTFQAAGGEAAYFGDPAAASAAEGRRLLAELGAILAEAVLAAVP